MSNAPTTDRGRATLERIVATACELFYRHGVHATGINDVIEASGTGKGQLYHYFDDKPDLILTVIMAQVGRALQLEGGNLNAIGCAEDLRSWGRHLVDQHAHGGPVRCPLGALVVELADNHPAMREALDSGFTQWRALIADALSRLQDAGYIESAADTDELAELLLCAYEGGVLLSEVRGTVRPLEIALTNTIETILAS